jgi:flagellar protein FlaG
MEIFNNINAQQKTQTLQQHSSQQNTVHESKGPAQQMQEKVTDELEKGDKEKLKKQLQDIVAQLNKEMDPLKTTIRFGFNDDVKEMYVSVIDTSNNEEIRKIPSEEAMRLAAKMRELVGMLFDKKG